uniref:F-box domain-containing protein n=1 Tax=Timema douglasi TaxID=61478 RepID=A0A7R8VFD3_TIMDO|nr:unnamed protein product [Timema douglasi]
MFVMSSSGKPDLHINEPQHCINDLPNEVLEYVFNLVSPYEDLKNCSLVCKKWYLSVQNVIVHTKKIFHRSLSDFRVICTRLPPPDLTFPIAKRYSHSACVHGAYNLVWSDELHQGIGIRAVESELNIFHRGDIFRLFFHFFLPLFIAGLLLLPDYIGGVEGAPNCDVIVYCYLLLIRAIWG